MNTSTAEKKTFVCPSRGLISVDIHIVIFDQETDKYIFKGKNALVSA